MIIDAALNPAEIALLPGRDLSRTTCVVFDILRATSSMITGLAHGVTEIWAASTIDEALGIRTRIPDAALGGERHGDRIAGFDIGNDPMEYAVMRGRQIVTTTTNGTVALRACEKAERVLVGALLNVAALARALAGAEHVVLVCAGTFETFALEDAIGAGELASCFRDATLTDAARACVASARAFPSPLEGLLASRNGQALTARGWRSQVEWCAQLSRFDAVGVMNAGVIRNI